MKKMLKYSMKPVVKFSVLAASICFYSCKSEKKSDYSTAKNKSEKLIKFNDVAIDSIQLDSINTSYVGEIYIKDNSLYFLDSRFCFLHEFQKDGSIVHSYIGQGSGKNELPVKNVTFFSFLPNGGSFFMGTGYDCYIFNEKFERINDYAVNWRPTHTYEELLDKPDPSLPEMYSLVYGGKVRAHGDDLIFPIVSQHQAYNPTMKTYAAEARIFASMSLKNGYIKDIYGGFPPFFSKNFDFMVFGFPIFDIDQKNNYKVSFGADSLIYEIDDNMNVKKSFGFQGRNMKTEFKNTSDMELFNSNYHEQSKLNGHYTFLEFFENKDLLFRGYSKGIGEASDGLQIYKDNVLIADIDVPRGFRMSGIIDNEVYSNAFIDQSKNAIKIYKFKLTN